MLTELNRFEKWMLRRIARKTVTQGHHQYKMVDYYKALIYAARKQFTEDNKPTLDAFLNECHKEAMK
jgi:uridine kinase